MTFTEFHKSLCDALRTAKDARDEFDVLNAILKAKMTNDGYYSVDDFADDKDGCLWRALWCSLEEIETSCIRASEQLEMLALSNVDIENKKESENELKH